MKRSGFDRRNKRSMRQVSPKMEKLLEELEASKRVVKLRDQNQCQAWVRKLVPSHSCNGIIHVHHIVPRSRSRNLYVDPSNLVCLCEEHHIGATGVHFDGKPWAVVAGLIDYEPGDAVDD